VHAGCEDRASIARGGTPRGCVRVGWDVRSRRGRTSGGTVPARSPR